MALAPAKTSLPSSGCIKPKPSCTLNHFTVGKPRPGPTSLGSWQEISHVLRYIQTMRNARPAALAVIESLYDAAMDDSLWPQALKRLADFTKSQAATFWVLDGSDKPRLPLFTSFNFDPGFVGEYVERMAPHDPWNRYLVGHPDEPIVHDGLVISEREKDRHLFYDWTGRHSDTRFRLVGRVRPAPAVHAGVALHRTRRRGRYEVRDLEQFEFLYRHLQRALSIGYRLGALGALQKCTAELLDRHPAAVLLLDGQKRVVYANSRAETVRAARDGIDWSGEGISAQRRQDDETLQSLIAGALSPVSMNGALGGVTHVERPSGKRPYAVVVSATSGKYPALAVLRPAICVMITDPALEYILPNYRLQAAFGLTDAEARLAALLGAGEDLRTAAAKLAITYGTARTRLTEIFEKTQTRRQGELIKLLLTTFAAG